MTFVLIKIVLVLWHWQLCGQTEAELQHDKLLMITVVQGSSRYVGVNMACVMKCALVGT